MKKLNNKGFSLVELIIVIAIMAVLIAVLAPQFLRYIERSRLQSDNTAIGEIANACKVAASDEDVAVGLATAAFVITPDNSGTPTALVITGGTTGSLTALQNELNATIGNMTLTSNTYATTAPTITVQLTGTVVQVVGANYIEEVGAAATAPIF